MATFKARVEDYVGTFSDTGALDEWLTAGAKKLVDLIPLSRVHQWTKSVAVAAGGTAIATYRVITASRNNYGATRRSPETVAQVQDSTSIWYALANDPAYVIKDGKIYIYPESGTLTAQAVLYPTVANGDSTIADYPSYFEQLVVLYAVIQALEQMINDSVDSEEDLEKGAMQSNQASTIKQEYERCLQLYFGVGKGAKNDAS